MISGADCLAGCGTSGVMVTVGAPGGYSVSGVFGAMAWSSDKVFGLIGVGGTGVPIGILDVIVDVGIVDNDDDDDDEV
jgi:hypothetical protein